MLTNILATTPKFLGRYAVFGLIVGVLGCNDGTGPQTNPLSVEIRRNSISTEEETIAVGGTLQLSTTVLDESGDNVSPQPAAQWRSTEQAIASVTAAGLVTGVSTGSALVIATVGSDADTVRVNVANPLPGVLSCATRDTMVRLTQVGAVFTTTADLAATMCIDGGLGGGEFTFVAFHGSEVSESQLAVDVTGAGHITAFGPPSPIVASMRTAGHPRVDASFHAAFREQSARALEPRLRTSLGLEPSVPAFAAVPSVGDLLPLNVETEAALACSQADTRTGRVVALTQRAIVVVDVQNPQPSGFSDAEYRAFGEDFDTLVWAVNTEAFGTPTDIDENNRVIIFFTRAVNELTTTGSNSYVAGFFFNRDLFRKTGSSACASSNVAEMFYMMAPDPSGTINGNVRTKAFIQGTTVGVLAHEFQHLINDSRRLYVNNAPIWEETWLNEGLSHIAEELVFYRAAGLAPGANIGGAQLSDSRVRSAFQRYNLENVERLTEYLQEPHRASLLEGDELATRGAIWAFLRYAADRIPGSDASVWKALVDTKTAGLQNLAHAVGSNPRDWMRDWAVSVYADDALPNVEGSYLQPSWNFRSLYPSLHLAGGIPSAYPLGTIPLRNSSQRVNLRGGGAAYVRLGIGAGGQAAIRTAVGGLPAPSRLKIAVVRTK